MPGGTSVTKWPRRVNCLQGAAPMQGAATARAALSRPAIPNPRPEDRRPKETRRPRSELIATPAEQQPIELGHSRNSDFGLLSGFGLRSSDFRAAEHDLPSTGRTLDQPCHARLSTFLDASVEPTDRRGFPLAPAEGERAGVRGAALADSGSTEWERSSLQGAQSRGRNSIKSSTSI